MNKHWPTDTFPFGWVRRSFRAKMAIAIFGVVCVTVVLVVATYYRQMSKIAEIDTYNNMEKLTAQSVDTIELYLESVRNQAWDLFSDDAVQDFVGRMEEADFYTKVYYRDKLVLSTSRNPLIRSIQLYNLDGMEIGSSSTKKEFMGEKDEIIRSALARGGVAGWEITRRPDMAEGKPAGYTLSYTQALKKIELYRQKEIGVLRIDLNIERFQRLLNALKMDYDGLFYIVDAEGVIVAAEDGMVLGRSLNEDPWFLSYADAKGRVGHSVAELDGTRWITLHHKFDTVNWTVIGKIPLQDVLSNVNRVRNNALLIGFVSVVSSLLIAYGVSFSVTRPLRTLRQSMRQIERGTLDISVPVTSRDEIGYLQLTFNRMSREIRRLITTVYRTEILRQEAEIKALQAQINPHFLYNALGTIDSFASVQGDKRISRISQALGKMFRYNTNGGNMATVQEEVEQVRLYLSIQQIRYEERLYYEIDVDPELYPVMIPKLLIQPVVENAMIHGVELQQGLGTIRIGVRQCDKDTMIVTVEDNGAGMTKERLQQVQDIVNPLLNNNDTSGVHVRGATSIGLLNVSQRIQLFYGPPCGLELSSEEGGGTTVRIVLTRTKNGGDGDVQSTDRR